MKVVRCTLGFVRSKIAVWTLAAFATCGLAIAQDSFMSHYSPTGFGAQVINRGDFNNDGIPDVITNGANTGSGGVSVSLGIGDGRFGNPIISGSSVVVWDMAIGDFNGDGKLDVAVVGYFSSSQYSMQILLGKGNGSFTAGQLINLASNLAAPSITMGDFNGDGKADLAVAADKVYLYKGAGNGTFSSTASVKVGTQSSLYKVRVADFNADGKTDLAVSDLQNEYVMWGNGNFTFNTVKVASGPYGISATPVDVNQDHFTDLVVVYYTCPVEKDVQGSNCTNWEVLLGSASKTFKTSWKTNLSIEYQGLWAETAADVNGDGINDVLGISNAAQPFELVIWLGNPDGTYQSTPLRYTIGSNTSASDLVPADFNRDGKIDFAMTAPGESNSVGLAIFLNATPRATCTPSTVSPSVTVCQPQDLIYSKSPVQWIADSRDTSNPVTAMQIYVDNQLVVNSPSSSLNEPLTLTNGSHFIVTKAWDKSGANFQSPRSITIYSGTPGEVCPASTNTLNICLPTQGQTTTTSVHVFANAVSADVPITAIQVYIDNTLIYNDTSGSTYVDTAFTVSKGPHYIVVKSFDANGSIYNEARNITAQ